MLTIEDIQNLIKAEKEVFTTKEDFEEIKQMFSNLQTSVDVYAKKADGYFQEMLMLAHRMDRHEKWIKQIADKLGIQLEY